MAEISGSVSIIWKLIVGLVVAVAVGAAATRTDLPEVVTELVTTIIVGEELGSSSPSRVSPSHSPSKAQDKDPIEAGSCHSQTEVRFKLLDHKSADTNQDLQDDVMDQVTSTLRNELTNFTEAKFKAFRTSQEGGDLTADVEICFSNKLSDDLRGAVYDILLNLVEVDGTIGNFKVGELQVRNDNGQINAFTYCNVTEIRCPAGANCEGDGSSCTANCKGNEEYCQNGGTCHNETNYISCLCPEGVNGTRCEDGGTRWLGIILTDAARVAIIAVAVVAGLLILLILLFCLVRRCRPCTKPSRELYGVENVVALHSIRDEAGSIGGVAIQTDDSFLLTRSYANGVPPKAGYSHKIMQTNESFLLARSQNPKVAQVKAQPHSQNGSPSTSENSNGSRESKPVPQVSTPRTQPEDKLKVNAEGTQTGGSLPRKIVKV